MPRLCLFDARTHWHCPIHSKRRFVCQRMIDAMLHRRSAGRVHLHGHIFLVRGCAFQTRHQCKYQWGTPSAPLAPSRSLRRYLLGRSPPRFVRHPQLSMVGDCETVAPCFGGFGCDGEGGSGDAVTAEGGGGRRNEPPRNYFRMWRCSDQLLRSTATEISSVRDRFHCWMVD